MDAERRRDAMRVGRLGAMPRAASAPSSSSVRAGKSFGRNEPAVTHELLRVVEGLVGVIEGAHGGKS